MFVVVLGAFIARWSAKVSVFVCMCVYDLYYGDYELCMLVGLISNDFLDMLYNFVRVV